MSIFPHSPFLPNQEAVGFPTTNVVEVSQQQTDAEKLPSNPERSTNFFTTIAQEDQKIEQSPASPEGNNTQAPQPIEQPLDFSEANNTLAPQPIEQPLDFSEENDPLGQVTNVSQLRDVQPADWAYEALRSLVERYGCIAGYPNGTFQGNRAMTRYEFAAGLNACLQQIEKLIASSTSDFVNKEDLVTLQRLIDEFRAELTTLGTRVDKLEGRTAFLEGHQFSTTTKLNGEVIFAISDLFGDGRAGSRAGNPEYANTETVFQDRVRLNFDTSFTGKDRLRTRLQAGNITEFGPLRGGFTPAIPGT